MLTLMERLTSDKVFDFFGGIHPPEHKDLSNHRPIGRLAPAKTLVVPLRQHLGELGEVLVKAGDTVLKGQPLSQATSVMGVPVHAPTSGTVLAVEPRPLTHASGLWDLAVVIEADGQNRWTDKHPVANPFEAEPAVLLRALKAAGLAGMGGAGFPTAVKLGGSRAIDALVINAAECEPYITSDDCLLREEAEAVVTGARLMARVVGAKLVVVGIEDNKPEAISALEAVIENLDDVSMKVVPTKYPSGAERQLLKLLTGVEVPAGGIPADLGLVVQNVGTAYAAYRALVHGEPLIKRVVTVTGTKVGKPGNYWLPIGTPIAHVLEQAGFNPEKQQRLIIGGPMMGFTLPDPAAPVTKTVNCLLLPAKKELPPAGKEMACIRCGECANVCPAELLPQQLYWYAKAKDQDKLDEYKLSACIECGACAFVCPSQIPLVQYYRVAKAEGRAAAEEKRKSDKARERFEARKDRLERDKQEREARHQEAVARREAALAARGEGDKAQDAVAAALARVKAQQDTKVAEIQKDAEANARLDKGELVPDNSEMARLREERKRQARERKAELEAQQAAAQPAPEEAEGGDAKKAAVAAAIARAKAKKAGGTIVEAAQAEGTADQPGEAQPAADAKKAAVAAAIARAKAKKAGGTIAEAAQAEGTADQPGEAQPVADAKKAAVAAAIARTKAKKAGSTIAEAAQAEGAQADAGATEQPIEAQPAAEPPAPAADAKKAAVAAAIARAKAKKAEAAQAQAAEQQADAPEAPQADAGAEQADNAAARKRAAIAAAVAKAKAKKAQEGQD
ncbi:electron transport complex subunit RsxC [Gallaecimonas kandeliae]|uniref:electron transport complex subunit RsxC n=1 Tax=Gallaecimonas kandeliae TaxID=3029055 RepID=UPI002648FF56|nr:electron transport complex subunit RsxC [Gallaecimonas kandeliae]WKE64372.1 electron transport complex subunit RsxC [Gallaecimonas kandeliae]